ncbi:MAG TPA: alanine racemase [Tepidisphaeraceae bacterium]|nr:alanine racemase [Tepidisphaeraceae bacterium]
MAVQTRTPIYAVVKADAYGLGAAKVAGAIADLVEGWAVFSLAEAIEAKLWELTGKPAIALGPPEDLDPGPWKANHVRPAVSSVEQAEALRSADPIVCVDTGMQRFACPADQLEAVISAGGCREAFTHATNLEHVRRLKELAGNRGLRLHAAATALLHEPQAWLDAVRPGLAMYRYAVRVSAPLIEARESRGPVGYSGFRANRHGVILCGYSNGLRKGPCLVNGQKRRVMEVGMQSAYVELGEGDRAGDEVVLLGDNLDAAEVAASWGCTGHEVLLRLVGAGEREYF